MEIELINYIKQAKDFGLSEFEIKKNLLEAGWEAAAVEEGFEHEKANANKLGENAFSGSNYSQAPSLVKSSQITSLMFKPENNKPQSAPESQMPKPLSTETPTLQPDLTMANFQKPKTKTAVLAAALGVIILAVGGYLFYVYAYNTPQKVWEKFSLISGSQIFNSQFSMNYEDKNELAASENSLPFNVKDLKLGVSGTSYDDITDPKNPQASAEVQYSFGSGSTNFNMGFKFRMVDKVMYLNVDENPLLNSIFQSLGKDQKIAWIKIDLGALQNKMSQQSNADSAALAGIFNENFSRELSKMWQDANLVKLDKYLGKEKIGNTNTFHFKNTLDKQALAKVINASIDKIAAAVNSIAKNDSEKVPESGLSSAKSVISKLVEKIEVKQFETWIGTTDFKLYKVSLVTNAPSVVSFIKNAADFTQTTAKAGDAKRLADIRQMASALELYFNDYNGYPESANGIPGGGITPTYIGVIPTSPAPPGGSCTDYYNTYWYQPMGKKSTTNGKDVYGSYELTFCLGNATGGYSAGVAKLSPSGIEAAIPCPTPDKPEQCSNPRPASDDITKDIQQKAEDFVSKLDFTGEFNYNATYSNYGKKQSIEVPADAFDVVKAMNEKMPQPPINDTIPMNKPL